ncbi:MAG: IS3 family transposase [Gammaproteobacteria bacterium]
MLYASLAQDPLRGAVDYKRPVSVKARRRLMEAGHAELSVIRQCELLELARSSDYYEPVPESEENLFYMRLIDEQYLRTPFYASRRMAVWLQDQGHAVSRKPVQRLMQVMGLAGLAPGPGTSRPAPEHRIYPYLLRGLEIRQPDQVWCTDITYVPMPAGFMYLVVIMDGYSRYVLAWEVSNTLDTGFCLEALEMALAGTRAQIFNSDQGAQFTSKDFTQRLKEAGVSISMDGRGRVFDNIFVERLWRTIKFEEIYLKAYATVSELLQGLRRSFEFYNNERFHQGLGYQTPGAVYQGAPVIQRASNPS